MQKTQNYALPIFADAVTGIHRDRIHIMKSCMTV